MTPDERQAIRDRADRISRETVSAGEGVLVRLLASDVLALDAALTEAEMHGPIEWAVIGENPQEEQA
jgi:hypothetical protein